MKLRKNIDSLPAGRYAVLTRSRLLRSKRATNAYGMCPTRGLVMVADLYTDTRPAVPVDYAIAHNLPFGGIVTIL